MSERSRIDKYANILTLCLFLQIIGQVGEVFFFGSSIGTTFFLDFDLAEKTSKIIEQALAFLALGSFVFWFMTKKHKALIIIAFWAFILTLAKFVQHSTFGYELLFGAHLARFALPLGMYFYFQEKMRKANLILIIGISSTFFFHGLEALMLKPLFIDYFLVGTRFLGLSVDQGHAINALYLIGVIDIILASIVFSFHSRAALLYMVFWGALTAYLRWFYHGNYGIFPMLIRSSHWGIPLFLFFIKDFSQTLGWDLRLLKRFSHLNDKEVAYENQS